MNVLYILYYVYTILYCVDMGENVWCY